MEKRNILLIEDDDHTRELVARHLRIEGYEVQEAPTGERGLEIAIETNPDLVLLDVLLPHLDGWEVLAKLREDPRTGDLPVIIITALTEVEHKVHGLRGGADDYVSKPFSASELMARIEAVLKRAVRGEKEHPPDYVPGRKGDRICLVRAEDINYVDVHQDNTYIHTDEDSFIAHNTLAEMERSLNQHRFFRTHRSYIVNLGKVKEISRGTGSSFELTLSDPSHTRIPLSRRRASALKKKLNL